MQVGIDAVEHDLHRASTPDDAIFEMGRNRSGHGYRHTRASRGHTIHQSRLPRIGYMPAMLRMYDSPNACHPCRQGGLVPDAAVRVDHVRPDLADVVREATRPHHGEAWLGGGLV